MSNLTGLGKHARARDPVFPPPEECRRIRSSCAALPGAVFLSTAMADETGIERLRWQGWQKRVKFKILRRSPWRRIFSARQGGFGDRRRERGLRHATKHTTNPTQLGAKKTDGVPIPEDLTQDFWRQARRKFCARREHSWMLCDQVREISNAAWRQKDASGGL